MLQLSKDYKFFELMDRTGKDFDDRDGQLLRLAMTGGLIYAATKVLGSGNDLEKLPEARAFVEHVRHLIWGKPRYVHDCDSCISMGIFSNFDLYYCPGEPTVIWRFGNEGHEYGSGIGFIQVASQYLSGNHPQQKEVEKHTAGLIGYMAKMACGHRAVTMGFMPGDWELLTWSELRNWKSAEFYR